MKCTLPFLLLVSAVASGVLRCEMTRPTADRGDELALERNVRSQLMASLPNVSGVTVMVIEGTAYLQDVPLGSEQQVTRAALSVPGVRQVVLGSPPAEPFTCPHLPWPPPVASAQHDIPINLVYPARDRTPTLHRVAKNIRGSLATAGYSDASLFAAPDGFAVVTRMEQIEADGKPKKDGRWAPIVKPPSRFNLGDFFEALFHGRPGFYRVIVIVVTPVPIAPSSTTVSDNFTVLYRSGATALPKSIGSLTLTRDYNATALIYEFKKADYEKEAKLVLPGNLSGREHMYSSNILPVMEKRRALK